MGKIMRNGVQYGVDTADVLSTVAECDASASGGKGTTQVASAKALSELNSNLKSNFQAGVDSIYDAVVAKGSTPDSKSLSDVVEGINNLRTSLSCTLLHSANGRGAFYSGYTLNADYKIIIVALTGTQNNGNASVSASITNGYSLTCLSYTMAADSTGRYTRLGVYIGYNIASGTGISMGSNWEGNHVILGLK